MCGEMRGETELCTSVHDEQHLCCKAKHLYALSWRAFVQHCAGAVYRRRREARQLMCDAERMPPASFMGRGCQPNSSSRQEKACGAGLTLLLPEKQIFNGARKFKAWRMSVKNKYIATFDVGK